MTDVEDRGYDPVFYRELDQTGEPSARAIAPLLLELAPIASAVDLGCGDGGWLAALRAAGVEDVLGLDGPWVDAAVLKIPHDRFRRVDLDAPVACERRFDLALSLEVAEHLPASRAAGFVAELCALAPLVLFSAAIPGQGGVHHVNERWPAYWAELFAARGYRAVDCLRPAIWNDARIAWWYRQNLLLFVEAARLAASPALAALASPAPPLPLVHPERFAAALRQGDPGLGRWLRNGPKALRRSLRRRRDRR